MEDGIEINQHQRPKTSNKIDPNGANTAQIGFHNGITTANTTASTHKKSGNGQTAKSLGEDSIKRIIKKSKSKPNSRPTSANKKKGAA